MERLQKVIAHAGLASRRKAEELILEGKVKVNGKIVKELGVKVGPNDKVEVNEVPLEKEAPVYFLFYKPRGVISAVSDDKNRKVVTDYFPYINERIYPVGRLDYDTSGLLVLTNDGEFANTLMHPKHEVDKVYVAKVKGMPLRESLKKLEKASSWKMARQLQPKPGYCRPTRKRKRPSLKSRYMKAGTDRCAACSKRSAIP